MVNRQNENSDIWNLGIIIYEMIYGVPPFYSFDINNLSQIIEKNELKFPTDIQISESLKNLIKKLLDKNPDKRLGNNNDFIEIKNQDFFKDFNFDELLNKKIESPYKPYFDINFKNKTFENKYSYEDLSNSELININ